MSGGQSSPRRAHAVFNTRRQPVISGPVGPVYRNGKVMPSAVAPSTTTTYATAVPTIDPGHSKENDGPANPPPTSRFTKSRTFSVLSSLTQSLSRSSLASITNSSRKPSTSSSIGPEAHDVPQAGNSTSIGTRPPRASLLPISTSQASMMSDFDDAPVNLRLVASAQPSAYWSGRFTALHDRFESELLTPGSLQIIADAQAEEFGLRAPQPRPLAGRASARANSARSSFAPGSSTSAAALQNHYSVAGGGAGPTSSFRSIGLQNAAALTDDESRCRRVFLHLEASCVTDEARWSLYEWQQAYARKTGRRELLPEGGTMDTRGRVARWFGGAKRGAGGKRMSIA